MAGHNVLTNYNGVPWIPGTCGDEGYTRCMVHGAFDPSVWRMLGWADVVHACIGWADAAPRLRSSAGEAAMHILLLNHFCILRQQLAWCHMFDAAATCAILHDPSATLQTESQTDHAESQVATNSVPVVLN